MDYSIALTNFLNPPVMFFFLGLFAAFIRSDLEIPQQIAKFLGLYLLFSLGFQGGVELNHSGLTILILWKLLAIVCAAIIVPLYTFFILKSRFNIYDAGAIAASYGSVSAVTFITAITLLNVLSIPFGGYMIAAMALMETPAIIVGVLLVRLYSPSADNESISWKDLMHDAVCNGAVVLILGSLIIGYITGPQGMKALQPFSIDIFKGMLSFFLLDMGIIAARRMSVLVSKSTVVLLFAIIIPLINAACGMLFAYFFGFSQGDALLFTVLCASASYIAVPAAMRLAVPEANPGFYISMALGITFPFNIIVGLPLYLTIIQKVWSV